MDWKLHCILAVIQPSLKKWEQLMELQKAMQEKRDPQSKGNKIRHENQPSQDRSQDRGQ
jgi:hypothetical protein